MNAGVTLTQSQPPSAEKRRSDLMSVAAVVLAAGGSARFRKPKQFALFRGETFIRRIVAAAIEARYAPVVVVTGEDSAQVTLELAGLTVSITVNPHWQSGLGSSIVVGIRHAMNLVPDIDAALVEFRTILQAKPDYPKVADHIRNIERNFLVQPAAPAVGMNAH